MNANEPSQRRASRAAGFALGLLAYALWGVLPIYFKAIERSPAIDIVAHRVLWSLPFLALLIAVSRGWAKVRPAIARAADRRHPAASPRC